MTDKNPSCEKMCSPGTDVSGTVKKVQDEVQPAINRVNESVQEWVNQGKDAALEAKQKLETEARNARENAERYIQRSPFKSVLIAASTAAATVLAFSWLKGSRKD